MKHYYYSVYAGNEFRAYQIENLVDVTLLVEKFKEQFGEVEVYRQTSKIDLMAAIWKGQAEMKTYKRGDR